MLEQSAVQITVEVITGIMLICWGQACASMVAVMICLRERRMRGCDHSAQWRGMTIQAIVDRYWSGYARRYLRWWAGFMQHYSLAFTVSVGLLVLSAICGVPVTKFLTMPVCMLGLLVIRWRLNQMLGQAYFGTKLKF